MTQVYKLPISQNQLPDTMKLPNSVEAEQALLGAIMINNDCLDTVSGFLKPEHFGEPLHGVIYSTMSEMIRAGRPVNPITMKPYLPAQVLHMTGIEYAALLASEAVTTINSGSYGRAVLDTWAWRRMISLGETLVASSRAPTSDTSPQKLMALHVADLGEVGESLSEISPLVTIQDAMSGALRAAMSANQFQQMPGLSTGVEAIDQLTGPWEEGQLVIIGGGTKMGKTALAMQAAMGIAEKGPVWIYSGEMSMQQLARREVARRTGIPAWKQKEGRFSQDDAATMASVVLDVAKLPVYIEKDRLTLEQIEAKCVAVQRKHCLAAVVIDHVGLVRFEGRDNSKEEWQKSAEVTQFLKAMATRLGIVVIATVQLKKNTFAIHRGETFNAKLRSAINNRPTYTDLMGAVERDADHVLIPFQARPILASIEPPEGSDDHITWEAKMQEYERKAEIILALSREQQFPARREVIWNGPTTSFERWVGRQETLFHM